MPNGFRSIFSGTTGGIYGFDPSVQIRSIREIRGKLLPFLTTDYLLLTTVVYKSLPKNFRFAPPAVPSSVEPANLHT
ncbi:MAG: hypothetical protein JWO20_805 [Candidatus Angelobacter sp.]|nr:hypothetical protein [Candidatus Angelobacter sp.]